MIPWLMTGFVTMVSLLVMPRIILAQVRRAWVVEDEERRGCDRMENESIEEIRVLRWKASMMEDVFRAHENGDDLDDLLENLVTKENARRQLSKI